MKRKILLSTIILLAGFSAFAQLSDLKVQLILAPEYQKDSNFVTIIVKNYGEDVFRHGFQIKISEADISSKEALKLKKEGKAFVQLCHPKCKYPKGMYEDHKFEYFAAYTKPIEFGKSAIIKVNLKNFWPYSPNCALKVEILRSEKYKDLPKEEYEDITGDKLDNNLGYFFEEG